MKEKRFHPAYSTFVLCGYLLAIAGILSAVYGFSKLSSIGASYVTENGINVALALTIGCFMALFATDMLLRQKVSHVAFSLTGQLIIVAYTLYQLIRCFVSGGFATVTGGVFYAIALLGELVLVYAIAEKALDGDASTLFYISFIVEVLFLLFASAQVYSFFDIYSERKNPVYWMGLLDALLLLCFSFYVAFVSLWSDFEPHPIRLDEFGNPVDDKK